MAAGTAERKHRAEVVVVDQAPELLGVLGAAPLYRGGRSARRVPVGRRGVVGHATNAAPMPIARAPTGTFRDSPAYLVALRRDGERVRRTVNRAPRARRSCDGASRSARGNGGNERRARRLRCQPVEGVGSQSGHAGLTQRTRDAPLAAHPHQLVAGAEAVLLAQPPRHIVHLVRHHDASCRHRKGTKLREE